MEEIKYVFSGDPWMDEYAARTDDVGRAISFYLRNRNTLAGFGSTLSSLHHPHTFPNNPIIKDITWWAERMRNVRIYNMDAFELIERLNSLTTRWLLIIDPPYVNEGAIGKKMYADKVNGQIVDRGFDEKMHVKFS